MSEGNDGWGCAPVFLAVILGASLLLFGSCTVLPGIDKWTASNEQVATINAQRDATIATINAQAAITIAEQEAQARVQQAAIELAGKAVDSTAGTLRLVIVGMFALLGFVIGSGTLVFAVKNWERL